MLPKQRKQGGVVYCGWVLRHSAQEGIEGDTFLFFDTLSVSLFLWLPVAFFAILVFQMLMWLLIASTTTVFAAFHPSFLRKEAAALLSLTNTSALFKPAIFWTLVNIPW